MAWTITISENTDTTGAQMVSGVCETEHGSFYFSRYIKRSDDERDFFIAEAKQALKDWLSKRASESAFVLDCQTKINAIEVK